MGIQVFAFSVFLKILRDSNSQNLWLIHHYQYNSTKFQKFQPKAEKCIVSKGTLCIMLCAVESSAHPQLLYKSTASRTLG